MSYYLVSCIGLTFILKYGDILEIPRSYLTNWSFFKKLFKCSLCLGFWVGVAHAIIVPGVSDFTFPLVSAAVCWSADSLLQLIQACEVYLMSKKKN